VRVPHDAAHRLERPAALLLLLLFLGVGSRRGTRGIPDVPRTRRDRCRGGQRVALRPDAPDGEEQGGQGERERHCGALLGAERQRARMGELGAHDLLTSWLVMFFR
jgi:hypothetical protein